MGTNYHSYSTGWQCPVCSAVNAPWVMQCPCGGQTPSYTITWPAPTTDWPEPIMNDNSVGGESVH